MLARLVFAAALFASQEDTAGSPPRAAIPAAVMRNAAAVCRVQCGSSVGSGCYLGDGLALTCRHLFDGEGNRAGVATFPDGRRYGWTLRALLSEWDAALIEFSARPVRLRGVRIARNNPTRGQRLYMAGWSTGRAGFRAGLFRRTVGRPGGQMRDWGQMERSGHGSAQSGDSAGLYRGRGVVRKPLGIRRTVNHVPDAGPLAPVSITTQRPAGAMACGTSPRLVSAQLGQRQRVRGHRTQQRTPDTRSRTGSGHANANAARSGSRNTDRRRPGQDRRPHFCTHAEQPGTIPGRDRTDRARRTARETRRPAARCPGNSRPGHGLPPVAAAGPAYQNRSNRGH